MMASCCKHRGGPRSGLKQRTHARTLAHGVEWGYGAAQDLLMGPGISAIVVSTRTRMHTRAPTCAVRPTECVHARARSSMLAHARTHYTRPQGWTDCLGASAGKCMNAHIHTLQANTPAYPHFPPPRLSCLPPCPMPAACLPPLLNPHYLQALRPPFSIHRCDQPESPKGPRTRRACPPPT
jgi:hypothetical protein